MQAREGAERGDLVLMYTGSELAPAIEGHPRALRRVDETLVLRDAGGVYRRVSGQNPAHGF